MKSSPISNFIWALCLSLVLALGLAGLAKAVNVTIDSFSVSGNAVIITVDPPSLPQTAMHQRASLAAIGGFRDLILTVYTGPSQSKAELRASAENHWLSLAQPPGVSSIARVQWDGGADDGSGSLDIDDIDCTVGLGSVDLTDSGNNVGISLHVIFSDLTPTMTIRLYSDCANWGEQTVTLPAGVNAGNFVDIFLPFSQFTGGAGTMSAASIRAIELEINSLSDIGADVQLSLIDTTTHSDFGDLPDSGPVVYGPALQAANHIPQGLILGSNLDAETASIPSLDAKGDDNDGVPDDEDGVTRAQQNWLPGATVGVNVTVNGCPSTCYLNGWVDIGNPGVFGAQEHILNDVAVSNGTSTHTFTLPMGYTIGQDVYARFRVCPTQGACDSPEATDVLNGEIEDYFWQFNDVTSVSLSSLQAGSRTGVPAALMAASVIGLLAVGGLFWRARRNRS